MRFMRLGLIAVNLLSVVSIWPTAGAAQTTTLTDIAYSGNFGTIRLPRIDVDGGNLSQSELRALFDMGQVDTLGARLSRLDARSLRIPEIIYEWRMPAPADGQRPGLDHVQLKLRDLTLRGIASGRVQQAALAGGSAVLDNAKDSGSADIKAMTVTDLDLSGLVRIYLDKAAPGETQRRLIYGSATFDGMSLRVPNAELSFGQASTRDYKARPLKSGYLGFLKAIEDVAPPPGGFNPRTPSPRPPDPAQVSRLLAEIVDILASSESGPSQVSDIRVQGVDDRGKSFKLAIARILFDGYAAGRFGRSVLDGLSLEAPDGYVRIGNMTMRSFDLSSMMTAVAEVGPRPIDAWLGMGNNARRLIPEFGGFAMRDLAIDVPDDKRPGERIRARIGSFDLALANYVIGIPTDFGLRLDDMVFELPPRSSDDVVQLLRSRGHRSINISTGFGVRWDEASRTMRLVDTRVSGKGLGEARIEATLANVPRQLFTATPQMVPVLAAGVTGKEARVSLKNEGFLELVAEIEARKRNRAASDVMSDLAETWTYQIQSLLGTSPMLDELTAALRTFARSPRSLVIEIRSRSPDGIGVADVIGVAGNPAAAMGLITLSVRANAD